MSMLKKLLLILCMSVSVLASAGDDIIFASAARTATATSSTLVRTTSSKGAHFVIDVTSVTGGTTITPKIQGLNAAGIYYDILVGSAISSTGTTVLKIYPGITPVANGTASDFLPLQYRVIVTHSSTGSYTYSVTESTIN